MEKQINQTVQKPAASVSYKSPLFAVLVFFLLLGIGLTVSMALLGGSLGRFSHVETNVISLTPPRTGQGPGSEKPAALRSKPQVSPASQDGAVSPRTTGNSAAQPVEYKGDLEVFDDQEVWTTETHVDLFQSNYDGTVVSDNGEKVIAPGTSNFYSFSLKNSGNIPLDYAVSLKVDAVVEERDGSIAIPLEWRLLDGEKTAVSDWREYGDREETLKEATLNSRHQDNYTIEWRWGFERGMDDADTGLGNAAPERLLGAKATITVTAEQSADLAGKPSDGWQLPKTGDPFNLTLWLSVLAVSVCGLAILFVLVRRRKTGSEGKHNGKKG